MLMQRVLILLDLTAVNVMMGLLVTANLVQVMGNIS